MLPSAICFVAYCPLFTLSLPTEWDQKRHNARHYSDKSSGHFPTAYAHSPTVKTQSQQAVTASGQWASSPLLLRSNAALHPSRVKAPASPVSPKTSRKRKDMTMKNYRCPLGTAAGQSPKNEDEMELMRRAAWRKQGVLNVAPSDSRLTWPEKELVKQIAEKLYGERKECQ